MKRFFHNNEDSWKSNEDEDEENLPEISLEDFLDSESIEIERQKNIQKLLKLSYSIAKSDWFWRFRSIKYKIKSIEKIYNKLSYLLEGKKINASV